MTSSVTAPPAPALGRYHRQMLLPGFGEEAQRRLLTSVATIVGCGALGSVIADSLARAGVGELRLIDRDFVELTNLQRQVLYDESDVEAGMPKAEAARRRLERINSDVRIHAHVEDLVPANIDRLLAGSGVILDGLDNFESRLLLNDYAVRHGIPYIYAAAVGTHGMTFDVLPTSPGGDAPWEELELATPCLRCIYEEAPPPGMTPTCDTAGVLGPVSSSIALMAAVEALKILTGNWATVRREMTHVDLWDNTFRGFRLAETPRAGCPCCQERSFDYLEGRAGSGSTSLCGRRAVQISPPPDQVVDLVEIARRLEAHGEVTRNRFLLRASFDFRGEPFELTLFRDGRAIVKGTQEPEVARRVYAQYVGT